VRRIERVAGVDRKKLFDAYENEAEHPLTPPGIELETGIKGQAHNIRYFFMPYLLGMHLKPGDLVLDLGCWNAGQTVNYAKLAEVIGIDISSGKLKQAQRGKHPHIMFIQADWDNLPLRSESVDWCIWDEGPEHAIDPDHVLAQIADIIRKGVILGCPLGPDAAVEITQKYLKGESQPWSGGHLHEFTEETMREFIERHLKVEAIHIVRHGFPGYQWLVGVGLK